MTYEKSKSYQPENVTHVERILRGYISIALLVFAILDPAIGSYSLFALTQVALYLGLTAFIGWDPIYAMLKQSTTRVTVSAPTGVIPTEQRQPPVSVGNQKKAA